MVTLTDSGAGAGTPGDPGELTAGTMVGAAYRIVRRIGAGGMGIVYLARDVALDRDVAVKVHRGWDGLERLQREARAMAQLAHPNVVAIHGVGRVDLHLYIAMEYVPGWTLSEWLEAAPRSWREVLEVMRGVGEGLAAAHDAGFVHRDLKPSNILIGKDGRARVTDFGLVRLPGDGPPSSPALPVVAAAPMAAVTAPGGAVTFDSNASVVGTAVTLDARGDGLTAPGATPGTPEYMAPEQHGGGAVDARADQFAYCLVLYEALYGRRPWRGRNVGDLRLQMVHRPASPPPRRVAPSWLWPVLRRGLAGAPGDRYPDLRALAAELRRAPRRRAALVAAVAAASVAVVGAGGWTAWSRAAAAVACDDAGTAAASVWTADARRAIAARAAALDPHGGAAIAARMEATVDGWLGRWRGAAIGACRARRADPAADATGLRQRCLDAGLDRLRGLVARGKSARDRATIDGLATAAAGLPDPGACADPRALAAAAAVASASELRGRPGTGGYWSSNFGGHVFRAVDDDWWAVYNHDLGTLRGRWSGDVFRGWWCEEPSRLPPRDAGEIELRRRVGDDGTPRLEGRWRYGREGAWRDDWHAGWVDDPTPPELLARFEDPFQFCPEPPAPTATAATEPGTGSTP